MANPKNYFHDHIVLLLLSIDSFLTLLGTLLIVLRLSSSHSTGYITQYRSNLGINAYKPGNVTDLLSFIVFMILVSFGAYMLSNKAYHIHRQLALVTLGFSLLLIMLAIIVSNALLVLR